MALLRLLSGAFMALLLVGSSGYFLWVEIPQFLFFRSTAGLIEHIEPVCFLASEGQADAADCGSVRARAGRKKVYQMYRATIRYTSPADEREHVETIVTRALGPVMPGATWKLMAHTSDANRVQPVNQSGRAILFATLVIVFVSWLRGAVNRYVRRKVQASLGPAGTRSPRSVMIGAVAFVVFLVFLFTVRP